MSEQTIPTFVVTILKGQAVFTCPTCGKRNIHGPAEGLRVSHCPCWPHGYEIKLPDDAAEGGRA